MKLYTYYFSSAAFRVRIALNLKGLAYDAAYVHLREGRQFDPDYAALNPAQQHNDFLQPKIRVEYNFQCLNYTLYFKWFLEIFVACLAGRKSKETPGFLYFIVI